MMVCYAAPVDILPREVKQADGTVITIRSFGDEFFSWTETMDGYVIAYDLKSKNWYYAVIVDDEFAPGSNIVGNNDTEQPWMCKHDDAVQLSSKVFGCVIISPKSATLAVGETKELTAYVNGPADRFHDYNITFSTSDTNIATIDDDGVVTAIAPGEVTITAASDHREYYNTATCKITVTADPAVTVPPAATFLPNETATLTIKCIDREQPEHLIYAQSFVCVSAGRQTIYAPDINNYVLLDETPKTVEVEKAVNVTVTFSYALKTNTSASPLPIQTPYPTDVSNPTPTVDPMHLADLTIKCVDTDEPDKVLYMQTIKNLHEGVSQKISAPPIKGYKFSGDNATVNRYIFDGHNTVIFNYSMLNYAYEINGLSLLNNSGEEITSIAKNESFIAEVEVNKKTESDSKDYIFVAVYDKNGALLNIDYVKAKFAVGECSFGFNVPATSSEIGSIKAFVWSDFNSMQPLAEPKIINLN